MLTQAFIPENLQIDFGGVHAADIRKCIRLVAKKTKEEPSMYCGYEETADRLLVHIIHAAEVKATPRIVISSPDTGIFVNVLYH
jgi:hypothetical protein